MRTKKLRQYASPRDATRCLAAEQRAGYDRGGLPDARNAVEKIRDALAELAACDPAAATDDDVAEVLAGLVQVQTLAAGQESRFLRAFDERAVHRADACLTAPSWLRHRTRLGSADARRRWRRSRVLARMPALEGAFTTGEITARHVDAVADRVTDALLDEVAAHDGTLAALARRADPSHVTVAVRRIIDLARQGEGVPACTRHEDLREVRLGRGLGDLGELRATVTPALAELLWRTRDLYATPDRQGTPKRSEAQRFHDALEAALTVAVDHHPGGGEAGGVRTHLVVFADLQTLLGEDELARIRPRLSRHGVIDPETARHLATTTNATLRLVLGLGPWQPINVGRARRTLPDWLRTAAELAHQHCRGPGCDRPFAWTEADHASDWADGSSTGLDNNVPECAGHHQLKHRDGWVVTPQPDGSVDWTGRDGRTITVPPPDP